jgi:hypothetical protein
MNKEPIVFLIDLDGTIQGDVHPQVIEYELILKVNALTKANVKYNLKNLHKDIGNGLIRPHFKNALLNIKKKHDNVEFFVYTASSDMWANFLLPNIIKVVFNKRNPINTPFLTRSNCIADGRMKSIEKVRPIVANSLRIKYPNSSFKHMYLIDNNIVLQSNEINKLIYCPSYDYRVLNCPLRNFKDEELDKYHSIISKEVLGGITTTHKLELLKIYYDQAFKEYIRNEKRNEKYIDDKYWKIFEDMINKSKLSTDRDVLNIVHRLRQLYFPKSFANVVNSFVQNFVNTI